MEKLDSVSNIGERRMMKKKIYQIKILLDDSTPRIWRKLLISSDTKLLVFHRIIQAAMGWSNEHMHMFVKNGKQYLPSFDGGTPMMPSEIDYIKKSTRISDLLSEVKDKIKYEYDFGDSWIHEITLEKILPFDGTLELPVCLDGKMACPPEDCGGVWGYSHKLEVLKDTEDDNYEYVNNLFGEGFDPEFFDIDEVNKKLKKFVKD